jgi:glutamine synthetase adenylyltransferase
MKKYEEIFTSFKKQYPKLQGENTYLQQELNSTRQLKSQINETKDQTKNSLKRISLQNKVQVTEIIENYQRDRYATPKGNMDYMRNNG